MTEPKPVTPAPAQDRQPNQHLAQTETHDSSFLNFEQDRERGYFDFREAFCEPCQHGETCGENIVPCGTYIALSGLGIVDIFEEAPA